MTSSWQQQTFESCDQKLWQMLRLKLDEIVDTSINQEGLIDNFYLPLFFKLHDQLTNSKQSAFVVGINAPQGGGKTTLTSYLVQMFDWCDLKAVALSIDDFYLKREDQVRIAQEHRDNIYLQQRGYPGTHDIELGAETFSLLKNPKNTQTLSLPRYDKSKHLGQGDRADAELWPNTQPPVDIILFEGWMLGFQALPSNQIIDKHLLKINTLLEKYHKWHQFLDSFIYLYPEDVNYVVDWRIEAEERMKAKGLPGMTTEEVREYAEKFLPAYRLYSPPLINNPPTVDNYINIEIGKNRLPIII
ncbi:MAG: D-glycerate 3-kinase [Gammaproteobacteria bacterium]|jgi:D-glycerate 3-kinase